MTSLPSGPLLGQQAPLPKEISLVSKTEGMSDPFPPAVPSRMTPEPIQKRLNLGMLLSKMPGPQLNFIITVLRPPAGIIPGPAAPPLERISSLIHWAEGEPECGLEQLEKITQSIISNPH